MHDHPPHDHRILRPKIVKLTSLRRRQKVQALPIQLVSGLGDHV